MMTNQSHNTPANRVEQLLEEGRPQEAIDLCRRACQAPEATPDDWLLYGCLSADAGDTATGLMALKKATELDPDFVEAQFGLGKLLAASGDSIAALGPLEKAAQRQPDNADIWLALGISHGLAKQAIEAETCCRRSLALQPDSARAHFNLANALQAQGRLAEAETEYQAALAIEPGLAMGWSMLAQARIGLNRPDEAEAAAARALALDDLGEAHFTLGRILEARGEMERARDHFSRAAQLLPGLPDAHLRLGAILLQRGDHGAAAESYQRAVDLDADNAHAHFLLAECLQGQRRPVKAEMSYRRALELNGGHLQAHYRFAFLLASLNRNAEAAEHLEAVLRINPDDAQARHLLAAQRGETTATAPAGYVTGLFDDFADKFDEKLVGALNYRTPEHLYEVVSQLASPAANSLDIIDLGCGTGLCAPLFRRMARTLHGVDLAPRMIEKARERKLYDALNAGDLVDRLRVRERAWDLAIATDVFIYVGDLQATFAACLSALKPEGLFAFSIESGDDGDTFVLRPTGRYAHSIGYIRSLAKTVGFQEVGHRFTLLRRESGKDVPGHLFLLRRPFSLPDGYYRMKYFFD